MQTLFFSSLGLVGLAAIIMFINITIGVSHGDFRSATRVMIVHIVSCLLYFLGGLGTIGFGIAWIVQALSK
jgi:hypothetical protein